MRASDISGGLSTGDPNLTAALMTCGLVLNPRNVASKVKTDRGDYIRFHFLNKTVGGDKTAGDLVAAWEAGRAFADKFPDDTMAACIAYSLNLYNVRNYIKQRTPSVLVRKGKQIALLDENAPISIESEILGRLR